MKFHSSYCPRQPWTSHVPIWHSYIDSLRAVRQQSEHFFFCGHLPEELFIAGVALRFTLLPSIKNDYLAHIVISVDSYWHLCTADTLSWFYQGQHTWNSKATVVRYLQKPSPWMINTKLADTNHWGTNGAIQMVSPACTGYLYYQ